MTKLWDQQLRESSRGFESFTAYRDLGMTRSFAETSRQTKKGLRTIVELSRRHNWQERVRAWDAHVDSHNQHCQIQAVKAMKERQIALAVKAQKAAEKGIKHLIKQFKDDEKTGRISPYATKPDALSRLMDAGCRLERLNRDEPEQSVEVSQKQNLDKLSLDEQEELHALIKKTQVVQ